MKKTICFLFFILFFCEISFAQKNNADPRIENILPILKLGYEKNAVNGDYVFSLKNNTRSQNVFVQSATSNFQNLEVREVYSIIYSGKNSLSLEQLQRLMLDTSHKHLGAWEMAFENDLYFIIFNAKVSANLSAEELKDVIKLVAISADEMENVLFAKDAF